jgi:hypothetical protein
MRSEVERYVAGKPTLDALAGKAGVPRPAPAPRPAPPPPACPAAQVRPSLPRTTYRGAASRPGRLADKPMPYMP